MKKKIIIAAFTVVGLILFKFAFTFIYNEWVISKYEEKDYSENFNLLEMFNFSEPYVVYYNNGNVKYQLKRYEEAIEYYEEALEKNPPEGKECPVRINLALAKLALLDKDCFSRDKIDDTIETLEECLDILSEEGCATEDGDGHDNRAQRLYDEIKELLEQAQQEKEQQESESESESSESSESSDGGESGESSESSESGQNGDGGRQSQLESQLQSQMESANAQRQEDRRRSDSDGQDWNWYYDEEPVW